tara:strand:+ start:1686 stop:2657 length:972 start_codon:yes stop_codon:yes gene_type:complete
MTTVRAKNTGGISARSRLVLNSQPESALIHEAGINGDALMEAVPTRLKSGCEKVIAGQNNTFLVFGRDRPAAPISGYGGKGHTGCGTIDIVAGLSSAAIRERIDGESVSTNPNPMLDASRVYISQKTDVDSNFGLAAGKVGNSVGRAAIAIKSDAVRIIGREGIKLVTSTDTYNSRGGTLISVSGIDLIAGNDDSKLQPMVKGNNLLEAMDAVIERVNELNGIVDTLLTAQLEFNSKLMSHTHPDIVNIVIGSLGADSARALTDGSTFQSPQVIKAGTKNLMFLNGVTKKDLVSHKMSLQKTKQKYLKPTSNLYINSRYNNTN